MSPSPYNEEYRRERQSLLEPRKLCEHCGRAWADEADHDPPLALHRHRPGSGCCRLIASCRACNRRGGAAQTNGKWRHGLALVGVEEDQERDGLDQRDRRWRVPWLEPFRALPDGAVWPRLMTVPHPRAVDSLGAEFAQFAEDRSGRELRWWQRLVAARLLEVDAAGELCWEALVLSMPRQLGKSWLLREVCMWRLHQAGRFGEPQDVLHTGKDIAICKEVQRPARVWAKSRRDEYRVREVNGQEEIERLADGSRWMVRAKEAVYGYAVSLAAVDEGWKVKSSSVDEGLTPTMVERNQPQLLLVSTAHRRTTGLMLGRRQVALDQLETGAGDLLIEWSAPQRARLDDPKAWEQASSHWTERRHRMIAARLLEAQTDKVDDPDEPDPVDSFARQWLNQWPTRPQDPDGATEPLLPDGVWMDLTEPDLRSDGPVWVAVEDNYGRGAAVAVVAQLPDGRLELGGWTREDWDQAMTDVAGLHEQRPVKRLLVGASLADRVPAGTRHTLAGAAETRVGLALFRDLVLGGTVAHDEDTHQLDQAVAFAQVREAATGLFLLARGETHLVRAAVWALQAAHRPGRVPAVM